MGRLRKQDKPEELPVMFRIFLLSAKKQEMILTKGKSFFTRSKADCRAHCPA
jgi:hypothetical protein